MKLLEDRILADGNVLSPAILKVDSFINHQVDPVFMHELGAEIARHFRGQGINKVMTIESSGIAPAVFVAMELQVPLVILKKQSSAILKTDVIRVMQSLRETGEAILDEETGLLVTRARLGNVTFLVKYREIQGGYQICRAYSHRMNIVHRL